MAQLINVPKEAFKYEVNLELNESNIHEVVKLKQYDTNLSYIIATLWNNGEQYKVTTNDTISFVCTKPSGTGINREAGVDDEGRIVYNITDSLTVKNGRFPADFRIYSVKDDGNGNIISGLKSTTSFMIYIEESALQNDIIIDSDDFNVLTKLITDATEAINKTNDATDNTIIATTNAYNAIDTINTTNTNIQNAENTRVNNESLRVTNENIRNDNEIIRQQNETIREQQENQRQIDTATVISNAEIATLNANEAADRANQAAQDAEDVVAGTGIVMESQKGKPNGVASLDDDGKIPEIQIPNYDIKDNTVTFTEAEEDKNIESGLKLSTIFSRLLKNIKSLRSNKIDKANIANNLVTTEEGMVLDARQGKELQNQLNTLNNKLVAQTIDLSTILTAQNPKHTIQYPQATKYGNLITLTIRVATDDKFTSAEAASFVLPAEYRPPIPIRIPCMLHNNPIGNPAFGYTDIGYCVIDPNGNFTIRNFNGSTANYAIVSVTYIAT